MASGIGGPLGIGLRWGLSSREAPSALDTLVWLTVATLVAIHHHHFSPQAGSKRSGFSISPR